MSTFYMAVILETITDLIGNEMSMLHCHVVMLLCCSEFTRLLIAGGKTVYSCT